MKAFQRIAVVVLLVTGSMGCFSDKHVLLSDSSSSDLFSAEDMEQARVVIEKEYRRDTESIGDMTIVYSGDERSMDPDILEWMNELNEAEDPVAAHMEFTGRFQTGSETRALNPNSDYLYSWHVARTAAGSWKLMTCGMG